MASVRLGERLGVREDLIKRACISAMIAHKSPEKPYVREKSRSGSSDVIISFPGLYSVNDWFSQQPFGATKVDRNMFPSLRSIGNDEVATVNEAFLCRFNAILFTSQLIDEVDKAVKAKKQVVFTGHSSGGPIAILSTIWFLENRQMQFPCVTFGSPLVGDHVFNHALRRQNWSRFFIHFVMKYDIVPRILLAPLPSSTGQELQQILHFLNPKSAVTQEPVQEALTLYANVMRNASTVTSRAACKLMGSTNLLLETVSSFIELSPYRPFGTYIFCTGNGKLAVIRNPEAVLQLLFYSSQLSSENEESVVPSKSIKEHLIYQDELQDSLEMQKVTYLDRLDVLPLSADDAYGDAAAANMVLNDLGLSTKARLCIRAAEEFEKQKLGNQSKIDAKKTDIEKALSILEGYKSKCWLRKVGYYDAFKNSKDEDDFKANVKRLELAGIWDEIIEMLKRDELPHGFESREEWVKLGTRYRRIVEPLDIANYYRHLKNEDTGPYLVKGRPRRYRYTQRWLEHALKVHDESSGESCFWAKVEELIRVGNQKVFVDVKDSILQLESDVAKWVQGRELCVDVLLEESTFIKWWNTLPYQHRTESRIPALRNCVNN